MYQAKPSRNSKGEPFKKKKMLEAGKMVYLAEPSAVKPDDLSSSPRTHRVEGVHRFWPMCGHFLQYSVNVKET